MESFCTRLGISQEFSASITPQQNGALERKNRVIQEMARAMFYNKDVARNLWGEAVNTSCHTINRVYFRLDTKKTPYVLWKRRKQMLSISEFSEVHVSFSRIKSVRLNLINHFVGFISCQFAYNSALRNLVFRWESCKGSV